MISSIFFPGVYIRPDLEIPQTVSEWFFLVSVAGIIISLIFLIFSWRIRYKYTHLSDKQHNQHLLMADISRSFLTDTNTDTLITKTLQMIGDFMNISQMLFFKLKDDGVTLICHNEWINPKLGLPSRIDSVLPIKEPMMSIIKQLKPGNGKDSCLSSNDPVIKKAMKPYRVSFSNYITTPVFIKDEMIGAIDFSKLGAPLPWSDSEMSLATLFASTLSGVFEREAMGRRTSIVENSPIIIFYTDTDGKMAYANPAAATITGYSLAELYDGGFELIFDEEDLKFIKDVYIPNTVKMGMIKHEVTLTCKNGKKRLLEVTSFVLKDKIIAAICVDLTETHALEAEIIKAKESAEQASRAKGEFLSNMSHEMRTPMNAIIGMTTIAKKAEDINKKNDALNKVEESSRHLLGIINDILDMSKIEANKLELSEVQFDLKDLLQKAVSFVRLRMDEKRLKFFLNVEAKVPSRFIGDDQRLTQVLTNLLSNAAKFTPEDGEISVSIFLENKDNGRYKLRFEVKDNGIGISPEQQQKIFNAFEQAESGTSRKFGGTGLGLAISKQIIELMGGNIVIESEIGKGTKFIFSINLLKDTSEIHQYNYSENYTIDINNKFTGKKLLLVEDIEINREVLISLLDGTGLIIDTAENGKEAFDRITAADSVYDIVFMDVQMPVMDGIEATKRIREFETGSDNRNLLLNKGVEFAEQVSDSTSFTVGETGSDNRNMLLNKGVEFAEQVDGSTSFTNGETRSDNRNLRKQIPIIAMTANVFKEDVDKCLAAGMNDHLGKPLEINIVFEKLQKYLSERTL